MKIEINREECIECGACETNCPDVFELPNGEKARVVAKYRAGGRPESGEVPAALESCAQIAADACPVSAITATK